MVWTLSGTKAMLVGIAEMWLSEECPLSLAFLFPDNRIGSRRSKVLGNVRVLMMFCVPWLEVCYSAVCIKKFILPQKDWARHIQLYR